MAAGSESVPLGDADSEKPRGIPGALPLGHPEGREWGSRRELRKQVPGADMVADFADMDSKLIGPPTFVTFLDIAT